MEMKQNVSIKVTEYKNYETMTISTYINVYKSHFH